MKSVLISIKPKWVEKIASGKKTIEVRKSAPKEVPFKVFIYATRPKKFYKCGAVSTSDELLWLANGKVEMGDGFKFWADGDEYQCLNGRIIGEFICDKVTDMSVVVRNCNEDYNQVYHNDECKGSCLTWKELQDYGKGKPLYGWHISDVKIYDRPKELNEFYTRCNVPESKCKLCDNCFDREDSYGRHYAVKKLTRPPKSWCYVEKA